MNFLFNLRSPSGVIYKSHEVKTPAPFAATFSSRGPNPGSQHILKVLIFAVFHACIGIMAILYSAYDCILTLKLVLFELKSVLQSIWCSLILQLLALTSWHLILLGSHSLVWKGIHNFQNSHSCLGLPWHVHVAGVAAYVKSFHPDWTPAAIRFAIITTGEIKDYFKFC